MSRLPAEPDGLPSWSPRYLEWSGDSLSGLGSQKVLIWSAAERDERPTVFFELRSLVLRLGKDAATFRVNTSVKQQFRSAVISRDLGEMGLSGLDFRPSLDSYHALADHPHRPFPLDPARAQWLRRESYASTEVAVFVLARWASSLKEPGASNAWSMMHDIFNKVFAGVPADEPGSQQLVQRPPYVPRICKASSGNVCKHCEDIKAEMPTDPTAMRGVLATFLCKLWAAFRKHRCAYALVWFKHLLLAAVFLLNGCLLGGSWRKTPAGLKALRGRMKRLRGDEDMQWQGRLTKSARRQGGSTALSCDAAETQKKVLESKTCMAYVESTYECFSPLKQLSVALDASTLSGEKMIFFVAYSTELHKAVWLVPQAFRASSKSGV